MHFANVNMRKQKRDLIIVSTLLVIILMVFFIFYIQNKKLKEDNKFCWRDTDCEIRPSVCGCYMAWNKNVVRPNAVANCIVKITKLFEENKSEIEEDSCPWKLETTIVKCIKNQCTLVEAGDGKAF